MEHFGTAHLIRNRATSSETVSPRDEGKTIAGAFLSECPGGAKGVHVIVTDQ